MIWTPTRNRHAGPADWVAPMSQRASAVGSAISQGTGRAPFRWIPRRSRWTSAKGKTALAGLLSVVAGFLNIGCVSNSEPSRRQSSQRAPSIPEADPSVQRAHQSGDAPDRESIWAEWSRIAPPCPTYHPTPPALRRAGSTLIVKEQSDHTGPIIVGDGPFGPVARVPDAWCWQTKPWAPEQTSERLSPSRCAVPAPPGLGCGLILRHDDPVAQMLLRTGQPRTHNTVTQDVLRMDALTSIEKSFVFLSDSPLYSIGHPGPVLPWLLPDFTHSARYCQADGWRPQTGLPLCGLPWDGAFRLGVEGYEVRGPEADEAPNAFRIVAVLITLGDEHVRLQAGKALRGVTRRGMSFVAWFTVSEMHPPGPFRDHPRSTDVVSLSVSYWRSAEH